MANTVRSVLWSLLGIVLCGFAGGACGWWVVTALGLSGVGAAIVGAIVGMFVATAAWTALTYVLRRLGFPA